MKSSRNPNSNLDAKLNARLPDRNIPNELRRTVLKLSGFPPSRLDQAAHEMNENYNVFVSDYTGPFLTDHYVGFVKMLRAWGTPFPGDEDSVLNATTLAQFFLVWAWEQCSWVEFFLKRAGANTEDRDDDLQCALVATVSATRALCRAKQLIRSGDSRLAQGHVRN